MRAYVADDPDRNVSRYTDKSLRSEAVRAVREHARCLGIRARCTGYTLELRNVGDGDRVRLVAHGEQTGSMVNPQRFDSYVSI